MNPAILIAMCFNKIVYLITLKCMQKEKFDISIKNKQELHTFGFYQC